MLRFSLALVLLSMVGLLEPAPVSAQASPADGWAIPTREMPMMPAHAELRAQGVRTAGAWIQGVEQISGAAAQRLSVHGEPAGQGRTRFVRISQGPMPVMHWTDRNGDGRADLIEIHRNGVVVLQIVDADFDGNANVLRYQDAAGALVRETRL